MCDIDLLYPPEYIGHLNFFGIPLHQLDLKPNCPILLVRNLNQMLGLCNGTRLIVSRLFPYILEATIVTGTSIGQMVYLPRIKFIHKDRELPFVFTRKQFPVKSRPIIYLPQPVFSHDQLYVALSRATSLKSIKVLAFDEKNEVSNETKNVVYSSLLHEVNMFQVYNFYIYFFSKYLSYLITIFTVKLQMARISELGYGCTGAELKIRILWKWIHHYCQTETWFLAVDEHGDAVQILGKKPNQHLLESKLNVLRCYAIEDYTCTQTRNYSKTILNPIHLNLGLASKITEIEDSETYPRHWFQFGSIEEIQKTPEKNADLTDVVGSFREIRLLYKDTGERFVKLTLTHESGQELNITLWNECIECTEKFDTDILNTTSTTDISNNCIKNLLLWRLVFQNHCMLTIPKLDSSNSRVPLEINALLPSNIVFIPTSLKELSTHQQGFVFKEILILFAVLYLFWKINSNGLAFLKGKTFSVRATPDHFTFNEGWFSAFCPICDTSIPKKGNDWFCITHGKPDKVSYSYTLSTVLDDTTKLFLILLSDNVVKKMCGNSSQEMIVELGFDDQIQSILPPTIDKCRFAT
ncbi:hypothetical protein LXL04_037538 [Taraxacum kok-saghyz]